MTMGTVPILDFRDLHISHPQGHGELGPPHPCRMEAGAGSDDPTNTEYVPGRNLVFFFFFLNHTGIPIAHS